MPLEPLERVVKLSSRVLRVLGHNPGSFSLQGTNMYIVGTGKSRILIDAGQGKPEDLPTLLQAMADDGATSISDCLITHYHHDHTEGIRDLRAHFGDDLRVWKMPWAPGILMPWHRIEHGPRSFDLGRVGVRMLADGDTISTAEGDTTLRAVHTPGHTVDHCCFVLREEGALFSGDHVLGGSSGVFEDLHSYMKSLERTLGLLPKGGGGRIYPGHGPAIADGHQGILDYIANRQQREAQVVDALSKGRRGFGTTPFGLACAIYPQLSLTLRFAAASNVEKTLAKLEHDGQARVWLSLAPFPIRIFGFRIDGALLRFWSRVDRGTRTTTR